MTFLAVLVISIGAYTVFLCNRVSQLEKNVDILYQEVVSLHIVGILVNGQSPALDGSVNTVKLLQPFNITGYVIAGLGEGIGNAEVTLYAESLAWTDKDANFPCPQTYNPIHCTPTVLSGANGYFTISGLSRPLDGAGYQIELVASAPNYTKAVVGIFFVSI